MNEEEFQKACDECLARITKVSWSFPACSVRVVERNAKKFIIAIQSPFVGMQIWGAWFGKDGKVYWGDFNNA